MRVTLEVFGWLPTTQTPERTRMRKTATQAEFSHFKKKPVRVAFSAGAVTGDAGLPLVKVLDDRLGLTARFAALLSDHRSADVRHSLHDLVRSRVYPILHGYEDCNDLTRLRHDPMFKAACDRLKADDPLPSQPTLSRFENGASPKDVIAGGEVFLEHYIERHQRQHRRPRAITLDMDTTDDPTHGQQELSFFHGYYDCYCYLELLIFSAEGDLLWAELVPSQKVLRPLAALRVAHVVERLRQAWPGIAIKLRADNGFAHPDLYAVCERSGVRYLVNAGNHAVLTTRFETCMLQLEAERRFVEGGQTETTVVYGEFRYQAQTWDSDRRVVVKVQRTPVGFFLRFLLTDSTLPPMVVYDDYAQRGQQENWIKDIKRALKSDRLSCTRYWANAFRLLLFGLAYQLGHELRRQAPGELRHAQLDTLRLKLLRVPALIEETARRLWLRVSRFYPGRDEWLRTAEALGVAIS